MPTRRQCSACALSEPGPKKKVVIRHGPRRFHHRHAAQASHELDLAIQENSGQRVHRGGGHYAVAVSSHDQGRRLQSAAARFNGDVIADGFKNLAVKVKVPFALIRHRVSELMRNELRVAKHER